MKKLNKKKECKFSRPWLLQTPSSTSSIKSGRWPHPAWVPFPSTVVWNLSLEQSWQPYELPLLFLASQGSLPFIARWPVSWVLMIHMMCTIFMCFKQEGISSPCYSILTRCKSLFSPLTFNTTKSSDWLLLFCSIRFSLLDSHYVQAKGAIWLERTHIRKPQQIYSILLPVSGEK